MKLNDEITQVLNSSKAYSRKKRFMALEFFPKKLSPTTPLTPDIHSKLKNMLPIFILLLFSVLYFLAHAFNLQLVDGKKNSDLTKRNSLRVSIIQPERGVIVDRTGKILAKNQPAFVIELDLTRCKEDLATLKAHCKQELTSATKFFGPNYKYLSLPEIEDKLALGALSIVVATDITKDDVIRFESTAHPFQNIFINVLPQRDYFHPLAFSHVLGYVGVGDTIYPSIQGKDGIEKMYDTHLKGVAGEKVYQVDSAGFIAKDLSERNAIPGIDLQTSIDRDLQLFAYNELAKKVDDKEVFGGAVVAQSPYTGEILALVSYPTYDITKMTKGISSVEYEGLLANKSQPFFNRAVLGTYPPGSTFKMSTATAVLMEKTVSPNYKIFDPGYLRVGSFIFRNWKLDGHGEVDLLTAMQKRNDTYFYTVGGGNGAVRGLGITKMHDWALKLGYGKKTGIDLPGEASGFMPDGTSRDWYLGDNFITAIGQGDVLATPLQVNNTTTFFANGGVLYKPRIALVEGTNPIISTNIVTDSAIDKVREGMKLASLPGGTGYPFFDFKTKYGDFAAGKTGTSEFINKFGKPDTHGWFTVFAPYTKPTITLTVFLEGGSTGSDDAAVMARKVVDHWMSIYYK